MRSPALRCLLAPLVLTATFAGLRTASAQVNPSAAPTTDTPPSKTSGMKWSERFAGSVINPTLDTGLTTFFPNSQQYSQPNLSTVWYILPHFKVTKDFKIRGRIDFSYEFTDTANSETTTKREPRFSDTRLWFDYLGIPKFGPGGAFSTTLSATLVLPSSPESQARTLVVSPGAQVGLSYSLKSAGLKFGSLAAYSHPFYTSKTPERRDPLPYNPQCSNGDTSCMMQVSGKANVSDSLAWALTASGSWGDFSASLFYLQSHGFPYKFQELNGVQRVDSGSTVRVTGFFLASVDYNLVDWMSVGVGYALYRNLIGSSGKYENPLWDQYEDMRVFAGVTFSVDEIIKKFETKDAPKTARATQKRQ